MSERPYIVFGRPNIGEEEIESVVETLRSGWVGTGPKVERFQHQFASYIGSRHAVALSSCTAALHLAMEAAGIGEHDEVITTPLTFAATSNAVIHAGATPVFADVDRATMNIDPAQVEARITPRTRAILPVHFAGRPCEMNRLRAIADAYGILLIGDAAHAIEAEYRGRKVGSLADINCFSFYVTKNMTTVEGGMLCTDDKAIADKVRVYALHGMSADAWNRYSDKGFKHYEVVYTGYKYNMTDIQASLGLKQLSRVAAWLKRRVEIWDRYDEAFADLPIETPASEASKTTHARHLYTVLVDSEKAGVSRDEFLSQLHARGVGAGVHYRALHVHPYYRDRFGYVPDDFPNASWIGDRTASLPLSSNLTNEEVERVIEVVRAVLRR